MPRIACGAASMPTLARCLRRTTVHTGFLSSWTANGLNTRVLERITSVLHDSTAAGSDLSSIKACGDPAHA